ncbi:MAG: hypothetical protein SF052_17270 [Bacteroidia bacterium]|nr:hypothetical protein [Bacteroidia bacterium]
MTKRLIHIFSIAFMLGMSCCKNPFDSEANHEFKGKFEYEIINDSLFKTTYLYESLGFLIGDLAVPGLTIKNIDDLSMNEDYIISLDHPIKAAFKNSRNTREEGLEYMSKKPLDIVQDTSIISKHIYIYQLSPKGKYRLLLP